MLKVPNRLLLPHTTEEDEDVDADELMSNLSRNSSVCLAHCFVSGPLFAWERPASCSAHAICWQLQTAKLEKKCCR